MKKFFVILILCISVFLLSSCGKQDPVGNFIPTPTPIPEQLDDEEDETDLTEDDETSENDLDYAGQTTEKYVKLTTSDGILNIRSTPSTEGEVVGFLIHGEKVDVIDIQDGWAGFVYQDEKCYVSDEFLVDEEPDYITQ